ncbi:MAG: hypothetical protein KKB20_17755 [Proteobacteria bacterium]|nr:hypothetical protein [Pseudomonadota bacterium]
MTGGMKLNTKRLTEMAFAYKQAGTLVGAVELDLFTLIDQGRDTVSALAGALDLPEDVTDKLVTACVSQGLLEKNGETYRNTPDVDRYLVRGRPAYYGEYLIGQAKMEYDMWKEIASACRRPVQPVGMYQALMRDDPNMARDVTTAGYNASIAAGYKMARTFDFSSFSLYLDLGGGSGCYSIPACESNPKLKAIVFDFPTVLEVTREFIGKHGLSDRISTRPGDFVRDDLPSGADVISIIGNFHGTTREEAPAVVRKAAAALAPGGALIISDHMLNDEKTGPIESALFNLFFVASSTRGYIKTPAEVAGFMQRAGLENIEVGEFIPGSVTRVVGRKPR